MGIIKEMGWVPVGSLFILSPRAVAVALLAVAAAAAATAGKNDDVSGFASVVRTGYVPWLLKMNPRSGDRKKPAAD